MAVFFELTDKPVRVTSVNDAQELRLAKEVLEFDELDLTLLVLSVEGAASVTVELQTGNQTDSTNGWNSPTGYAFASKNSSNSTELKNFKNFQRFLRWKINAFSGTAVTFIIQGVGRRWA